MSGAANDGGRTMGPPILNAANRRDSNDPVESLDAHRLIPSGFTDFHRSTQECTNPRGFTQRLLHCAKQRGMLQTLGNVVVRSVFWVNFEFLKIARSPVQPRDCPLKQALAPPRLVSFTGRSRIPTNGKPSVKPREFSIGPRKKWASDGSRKVVRIQQRSPSPPFPYTLRLRRAAVLVLSGSSPVEPVPDLPGQRVEGGRLVDELGGRHSRVDQFVLGVAGPEQHPHAGPGRE